MGDLGMPVGQLEGSLPPCVRIVRHGGRVAILSDSSGALCGKPHLDPSGRFGIIAGTASKVSGRGKGLPHPQHSAWQFSGPLSPVLEYYTDDPKEAERLWLEAQEVLLGEEEQGV